MRRRDFVTLLGSVAAWPLAASAQQKPVIGFLNSGSADVYSDRIAAFHQGLRQLGYIDGDNVVIVYRWALGQYDRLPAFAAELVEKHVSVLVATGGEPAALAAKSATSTIPSSLRSAATLSSLDWSPAIIGRVEMRQAQTFWLPRWTASVLGYCTR